MPDCFSLKKSVTPSTRKKNHFGVAFILIEKTAVKRVATGFGAVDGIINIQALIRSVNQKGYPRLSMGLTVVVAIIERNGDQNQQTKENPNDIQTYEVELLKNKQYFLSILNSSFSVPLIHNRLFLKKISIVILGPKVKIII